MLNQQRAERGTGRIYITFTLEHRLGDGGYKDTCTESQKRGIWYLWAENEDRRCSKLTGIEGGGQPQRKEHVELHDSTHRFACAFNQRARKGEGSYKRNGTWAMHIWMRAFLKLRISAQTCSSVARAEETCSMGMMQQWSGTRRPLY